MGFVGVARGGAGDQRANQAAAAAKGSSSAVAVQGTDDKRQTSSEGVIEGFGLRGDKIMYAVCFY